MITPKLRCFRTTSIFVPGTPLSSSAPSQHTVSLSFSLSVSLILTRPRPRHKILPLHPCIYFVRTLSISTILCYCSFIALAMNQIVIPLRRLVFLMLGALIISTSLTPTSATPSFIADPVCYATAAGTHSLNVYFTPSSTTSGDYFRVITVTPPTSYTHQAAFTSGSSVDLVGRADRHSQTV
jgi:hypothetical protein